MAAPGRFDKLAYATESDLRKYSLLCNHATMTHDSASLFINHLGSSRHEQVVVVVAGTAPQGL